ncbi:MAG: alcohol dehydrogenase [Gallionellales bacterium 35-53-114]|jgi:NADPH2:quinone reductase|nr:MAG: alcohol dehydrogenase [Gallionellales bacterium 35-53-114]OYZ63854.1 MAG: alcohol dehydrogenase [Gallionellales bacterium 24-53-125]OZB09316.1 MAG: alcohol dehydrogenase [Gallionellales bacterium 39-52-133]HQS59070.1 zinc-dependent alcohol dehydrogenase family protein [Gallionellaceae bacterium]HQS75806.1 zinc-dependent alcohol dehydrogenase family protein [Gallionellaceae bacterium]
MRAILMTAAGAVDVLQVRDLPLPPLPSARHIRVKLAAAGINPLDTKLRSKPVYYPERLPAILGCDGAGTVEATGAEVSRFKVGDAVYFCNGGIGDEPGCYAEYTTVHEDYCAAKPATFSMAESAALPLVLLTAWEALAERANLKHGQTILIHAGAGGVGHIAIQLACHMGARVAVTVSDEHKSAIARNLGAEKIILYRQHDFVQETLAWTEGKGASVVFDTVGGDTFLRSLQAVRYGGKLVSLLSTPLSLADSQIARLRNLSLCYELMLAPQLMQLHDERVRQRRILEQGAQLAEAGKLKILLSKTLPLAEAAEAHRLIEQGGISGKIVLEM